MYPLTRLVWTTLRAFRSDRIEPDGIVETTFRCRPWDLDMFLEMNNGRVLTLYDLGRFDLSIRAGLAKVLKARKWGLSVAGSSVRYRKRIHIFDKVTMRTQVLGYDDRWIFIGQSMWVKGKPVSSVLVRTCVTETGRSIPTEEILKAMNISGWSPQLPDWVTAWHHADHSRPWPPTP